MTHQKNLAIALSLMLIIIMGTMHRSYASHITQHTHHSPTTHSTGVCSWMCAAAQTISGDAHVISHKFRLLALIEWTEPDLPSLVPFFFVSSRAPPR